MTSLSLPSIAAGPATNWNKHICSTVSKWSGKPCKSLPLEGTIGVSYTVKADLKGLFTLCDGDRTPWAAVLKSVVKQPTPGFKEEAKPITPVQMDILYDFVEWAEGDQPFFLLRKGREVLGLCRKTSGYSYAPEVLLSHRVSYEMVVECSPEQKAFYKSQLSRVPATLVWLNAEMPKTTTDAEILESLRTVRTRVAEISYELDALLNKLK